MSVVVPVRGLVGGWGRGFLAGDGLGRFVSSSEGIFSGRGSFSLLGLTGGTGRCTREGIEGSFGSGEGPSGLSFGGFLGGRGLANLGFGVLSFSTYMYVQI